MELKTLLENASLSFSFAKDLFKHNLVVFLNGEGALQSLPPLVDVIPEARLNLVIYYLKQGNIPEAYELMKDIDPSQPNEYILKGVVNAAVGQEQNSVSLFLSFLNSIKFEKIIHSFEIFKERKSKSSTAILSTSRRVGKRLW